MVGCAPLRRCVGKLTPADPEAPQRRLVRLVTPKDLAVAQHFKMLDDDETPLRLTASQTATTRGVMVSGIMGALDNAPTLQFVERGLKITGEEWIKVMDEYIVPIAQPSWSLGVSFY